MSTTDRTAFEQYAESQGCRDFEYDQNDSQRYRNPFTQREYKYWRAALDWQAATEAAKATGTAGELPPLPEPTIEGSVMHQELKICYRTPVHFTADQMHSYGQACAEAARQPAPVVAVKRYDMTTEYNRFACEDQVTAVESADGAWVKYEDHLAATRSQP